MLDGPCSLVKATFDYFGENPNVKKVSEFQALSSKDREDLRALLRAEGYDIADPVVE